MVVGYVSALRATGAPRKQFCLRGIMSIADHRVDVGLTLPTWPYWPWITSSFLRILALFLSALAELLKQHHEKVYEVEIERKRTQDCLLTFDFVRVCLEIHLLNALRVVCGKAHEYEDADDGDCKLKDA
jgi:hypothetical protein